MSNYQEIEVACADGYAAYARYWPAPAGSPAVLYFHGIQSHCGWYTETARAINAAGFAVLQPDRRGSGRNSQARGHADSPQQLIDDAMACVDELRRRSEAERVHLVGVSWGGKLAAAVHIEHPEVITSLTLVAPGLFPIVDVSNADKFRIGWSMVSNPTKLFDIPLNDPELFTGEPDKIAFLRDDHLQLHQATAGFFLASRRMDKLIKKLPDAPPVPIHLLLAGEERIIDNASTRAFVESLPWPNKKISIYPESRHTIEYGPERERFVSDIIVWLQECDASPGEHVSAVSAPHPDAGRTDG